MHIGKNENSVNLWCARIHVHFMSDQRSILITKQINSPFLSYTKKKKKPTNKCRGIYFSIPFFARCYLTKNVLRGLWEKNSLEEANCYLFTWKRKCGCSSNYCLKCVHWLSMTLRRLMKTRYGRWILFALDEPFGNTLC